MLDQVSTPLNISIRKLPIGKQFRAISSLILALSFCWIVHADQIHKDITEPIFNSKVYIEEFGNQNEITLVLVHGTGTLGAKIWDSTISDLKDSFHIVTFDLPGFGRSEKKNALYSPAKYARFLNWIIKHYTTKPVYLVGHSLGGAIALYYAGIYPDKLERLILVDAAGILHRSAFTKSMLDNQLQGEIKIGESNLIEKPLSKFKHLVNTAIENIDKSLVPDDLGTLLNSETFRETALNGDPSRISGMALIHTDFSPILDKVKVPTVIIWGENDPIAPLRTAKILAYRLKHSSLSLLSRLEHNPMLEDPETFNSILLQSIIEPVIAPFLKIENRKHKQGELTNRQIINQINLKISGDYNTLKINQSKGIVIRDVRAQSIEIDDSEVMIENSFIQGKAIGLKINDSIVYLTGSHISADTAIRVYNSNLDIAGSLLKAKNDLIKSERKSTIVFSVCKVESPKMQGNMHTVISLKFGERF